jgi:hypothetical protein
MINNFVILRKEEYREEDYICITKDCGKFSYSSLLKRMKFIY